MFDVSCGIQCSFLWDGFGNWVHGDGGWQWRPLLISDGKKQNDSWFGKSAEYHVPQTQLPPAFCTPCWQCAAA